MYLETIKAGSSWTVSASFAAGTDLTGWKWAITVKRRATDADADAVLTLGFTAASAGEIAAAKFSHTFAPIATNGTLNLSGRYFWDMKFIRPSDGIVAATETIGLEVESAITLRVARWLVRTSPWRLARHPTPLR